MNAPQEKSLLECLPSDAMEEILSECAADPYGLSPVGMTERIFSTFSANAHSMGRDGSAQFTASTYNFSEKTIRTVIDTAESIGLVADNPLYPSAAQSDSKHLKP